MKLILTDSLIVETLPLPDNRACNLILSVLFNCNNTLKGVVEKKCGIAEKKTNKKKNLNSTVNLFFFLLKICIVTLHFSKLCCWKLMMNFQDEKPWWFFRKKNKLLMNVLKIMPLSVFFSLPPLLKNQKREGVFCCPLTSRWLTSNPTGPGSAERSEYQSDLSKGIPACSHHFYFSGHTQPLVITSRPQSLPSHTLASKRRRRRISCRVKRKLQSKDKRYYSPSSGRARDLTAAH